MTEDIVLDTNVIVDAVAPDNESDMESCGQVFFTVLSSPDYSFSIDNQCRILEEYKKNLKDKKTVQSNKFQQIINKYAYSGDNTKFERQIPIDESEVSELVNQGFHKEDLIFIRVGPRSQSESVISSDQESIVHDEYKEWIEDNLEITICLPSEAENEVFD
jgi:hypothetical protein